MIEPWPPSAGGTERRRAAETSRPTSPGRARRGYGQDAGLDQFAGDQRSAWRLAEAQREVEAIRDQIADLVAHDQFKAHFGVAIQEGRDLCSQYDAGEERVDIDAQAAAHGA